MSEDPKLFFWTRHLPGGPMVLETDVTLRDLFAGLALAGLLANTGESELERSREEFAADCYGFADAMLAARTPGAAGG